MKAQQDSSLLVRQGKSAAEKLFALSLKFKDTDALKCIDFARQAIRTAQKENLPDISIRSYLLIGRIQHIKNELPEAYEEYRKALDIALSIKDSVFISKAYHDIGDVYKALGMFEESVRYLEKALSISERIHDSTDISAFADRLGHVYMDHGEATGRKEFYDKAFEYYHYSLAINKKTRNIRRLCNSYVNLANAHVVFMKHGGDSSNAGTSIAYSRKGIEIAEKNNLPGEKAINLLNVGEAYLQVKAYDKALFYFEQAKEIYTALNIKLWLAATMCDIALAYEGKGQIDEAIYYVEKSNALTREFDGDERHENYLLLSKLYEEKKDFGSAFAAYKKYQELMELSYNTQSTLELERMQMAYDSEKKDMDIKFLNEEKKLVEERHHKDTIINYVLLGLVLLVIAIAVLLFNRSRILQRSKELSDKARIMQEQFLANTSHEVRTPMNGIIGMANQLMNTPLNHQQKQYVEVMKRSSDNLLRIINDILDLSKIKAGKLEFYTTAFEPKKLFDEIYLSLSPRSKEKGLALEFIISSAIPEILVGDAMRIEQILVNLLDNALKFTEVGKVVLEVKQNGIEGEDCNIEFIIRDTGPGIPPEHKQHIFESFFQLENAGERRHGGAGLGLSIVKYLVENLGGKISVSSEEARGTTFNFCISFKVDEGIKLPEKEISGGKEKDLAFASILVVEDNAINQKVIETTLQNWNCQYTIVSSAVECFYELEKGNYEVILMDIELPGISGREATKYIRNKFKDGKKNIPIVALTAYALESEKIKCVEDGMNEVIIKPFSPDALYGAISRVLSNDHSVNCSLMMSAVSNHAECCSSLEELAQRYRNNPGEFKELLQLFKEEIPVYLGELKAIMAAKDADSLKKIVHKMKSPLNLAGANELVKKLELLVVFGNKLNNNDSSLAEIDKLAKDLLVEIDACTASVNALTA